MKTLQILQKVVYEKFYVHGQILRTQNCRPEFVKKFTSWKTQKYM